MHDARSTLAPVSSVADAPVAPAPQDYVIEARSVSKLFEIFLNDRSRFLEFFGRRKHHQEHWALRDVSFKVRRGRSFGLIGANGAGKSTMLKLIAGISEPTSGTLDVRAPISTLLDLGLGFHGTFSGRENILLNCTLLGMSREEAEARVPAIIRFAELGDFIDYPVRTYSSGMALRLGFAIAAHLDSEIFLIDEVLAVGDQYFQRKCVKKIEDFLSQGRTIVLVSHDLHAIRSLCDEVLWLDGGEVRAVGPAREVVERYLDLDRARSGGLRPTPRTDPSPLHHALELPPLPSSQPRFRMSVDDPELKRAVLSACAMPEPERLWAQPVESSPYETYDGDQAVLIGSGEVRVLSVRILDARGAPRLRFRTGEPMVVAVTFRTTSPVERPVMGVALHRNDGVYVYGPNTRFDGVLDGTYHGIYTYFLHYPRLPLLSGRYEVSVAVFDKHHLKPHVWHNRLYELEVAQEVEDHGLVYVDHAWGLITHLEAEGAVTEPGEP